MKNVLCLLPTLLLLLAGCGDTINGKSLAEPQVAVFHERLNQGEFAVIYNSASKDFQQAIERSKAEALFSAIIRKLGKHQSSTQADWNVRTHNLTTMVVLAYKSTYAAGEATETFTFRIQDGKAEMIGYNISSIDMLIK